MFADDEYITDVTGYFENNGLNLIEVLTNKE